MFKSQLNTYWKNLDIKFMPDVYGPEVTGNTQSRRVSGAPGPDVWPRDKVKQGKKVDCIQSFCHSLFLLVVDLPNGSDFPKPVGNTAIQYFLSMRHSRIVLCYCFNSSMPNSGKISVEALSKKNRMEAAMFFLNNTEDT
jgi:hypothetical protein